MPGKILKGQQKNGGMEKISENKILNDYIFYNKKK